MSENTRIREIVERQRAGVRWQVFVATALAVGFLALLMGA